MPDKLRMTTEGYHQLKDELKHLQTEKRAEISEKIRIARGFGDLSENSEYDEAKNEQAIVEARISQLEAQLTKAILINEDDISTDVVGLGSTVTILDLEYDEEMTYKIVTSVEANTSPADTISDESPVGKALMGHKVGEAVKVLLPSGSEVKYKILEIML